MRQVRSEEARRTFRELLDEAERGGGVQILRYDRPVAVLVSADGYEQATLEPEDQEVVRQALSDAIAWVEAGHGDAMAADVYKALLGRLIDRVLGGDH